MIKTVSRISIAAAAALMVVTPIAAQANTRASDTGTVYNVDASPGIGRVAEGESIKFQSLFLLIFLSSAPFIASFFLSTNQNNNGQSEGT
jgi:hypothetical protein